MWVGQGEYPPLTGQEGCCDLPIEFSRSVCLGSGQLVGWQTQGSWE